MRAFVYLHFTSLLMVTLIGCNMNDPQDPMDPMDPPSGYIFECPVGIDSDCPIEGTYYEVNPLFHPNNFKSWTFNKESIGSPYYHISISQISPQCDKITLRGQSGQVQRDIPIIALNDSMLVIRDVMIRPDNIVLIRSQGGRFKDFYCDSTCVQGCHDETDIVDDLCRCDEFEHGWKCSLKSFLFDFTIDDYVLDAVIDNNSIVVLSSDVIANSNLTSIHLTSIMNNGGLNWSNEIVSDTCSAYCGYVRSSSGYNFSFLDASPNSDSAALRVINTNQTGIIMNDFIVLDGINKFIKLSTWISTNNALYIMGTYSDGFPSVPKLHIMSVGSNGALINSKVLENLSISVSAIGSFDSQANQIVLADGGKIYKFSATSFDLVSTIIATHGVNGSVISSDGGSSKEHYYIISDSDSESQNPPDRVITYLYKYLIYDERFQGQKVLWTPGIIDYLDFSHDLFKNSAGNYFYVETAQNTLRFGKHNANLTQMEYHYTYPYVTPLSNPTPRQFANGDYVFICNTNRFGPNRDFLVVVFSENGLYQYTSCL